MEDQKVTYEGPIISFTDQSASFVHGWEMGKIAAMMSRGEPIEENLHRANAEVFKRTANLYEYRYDLQEYAPALDTEGIYYRAIAAPKDKIDQ